MISGEERDGFPLVSVILPALNEEETVGECIIRIQQAFTHTGIHGEIIVSDSSTDRTAEIAEALGARVIHPSRRGYGSAYLEAFAFARGDIIVIGDADNTYDFQEIPALIAPIRAGKADLVVGSRFAGTIHQGAMTCLHRYIGNPVLTWLLNTVFSTSFSDAHSGFRAFRRDIIPVLRLGSAGMEFASEMLIKAAKAKVRIEEVPIQYYPRNSPSKLHSFADGWRHVRFILLMKPTPFLVAPGLIFSILGLALMVLFWIRGNIATHHLHSFILGALLLSGGVQVILTGFLVWIYSVVHGYEEKRGIIALVMDYHSLEKFLLVGGIMFIAGIVTGISIILEWAESNFGALSQISQAIVALTLIMVGLEVVFSAIFMSMMLLNEGN